MKLKAVFFDLDDTVLEPLPHNPWAMFRQKHGLPQNQLILEGIKTRPAGEHQAILRDLLQYELDLAAASQPRAGIKELLLALEARGLQTALLTNNHRQAVNLVLGNHRLEFHLVLTREDAAPKPRPDLLLRALDRFQITPQEAIYVGDSKGDLDAAVAAQIDILFLATPHNLSFSPRFVYPAELLEALLE
jgi:HAD superfamily hydrolase (TIGR01509 family)